MWTLRHFVLTAVPQSIILIKWEINLQLDGSSGFKAAGLALPRAIVLISSLPTRSRPMRIRLPRTGIQRLLVKTCFRSHLKKMPFSTMLFTFTFRIAPRIFGEEVTW